MIRQLGKRMRIGGLNPGSLWPNRQVGNIYLRLKLVRKQWLSWLKNLLAPTAIALGSTPGQAEVYKLLAFLFPFAEFEAATTVPSQPLSSNPSYTEYRTLTNSNSSVSQLLGNFR